MKTEALTVAEAGVGLVGGILSLSTSLIPGLFNKNTNTGSSPGAQQQNKKKNVDFF